MEKLRYRDGLTPCAGTSSLAKPVMPGFAPVGLPLSRFWHLWRMECLFTLLKSCLRHGSFGLFPAFIGAIVTDMNDIDLIRLISGLLQFGVAWYALRLGRLFKATVMGWLLFGGLTLLALVSLFLAVKPLDGGIQWGIKVDIIYSLFSLLLLAGMMRFYTSLKNFLRSETAERQALDKWESQVKEQWVELNKANERLRQTVSRLESETVSRLETEIAERKQAQENLEAQLASSRQSEQVLQRTVTALRTGMLEPPRVEPLRVTPRRAESPRAEQPRVEPARVETKRAEPPRTEPVRAEPSHAEPARVESPEAEPPRAETPRTEPRAEVPRVEPSHAETPGIEPPRAEAPRVEPPRTEAPDTAKKNGEPPPPAPAPSNGEVPRPVSAGTDTKIITAAASGPVKENGGPPPAISLPNDRELRPAVPQPGPGMNGQKPLPEPPRKNGEPMFITERRSQSEPWDTLFHEKTTRRRSSRAKRKKTARAR